MGRWSQGQRDGQGVCKEAKREERSVAAGATVTTSLGTGGQGSVRLQGLSGRPGVVHGGMVGPEDRGQTLSSSC
jgi:hypothetical protein